MRRKEDAVRYGIKPKQQVIGINIKRQDEMQGVLLLHRKRQGKSLLMSWRVQQERRMSRGLQSKCERCKWKFLVENDQVKEDWRKYKEKLLNEDSTWDNATLEGPCELIRRNESLKALRMTKKGKAADPTGIASEMFIADEDCNVEWLTSLCNLIVAHGRIPDDWKISILLPVFNGKVSKASQSFICRCQSQMGLILICIWILVMGYHWKR